MSVRFNEEEKKMDEEDTLELLLQGESYSYIAKELGRSVTYISDIVSRLIEQNKISEGKIKGIRKKKIEIERKSKKLKERKIIDKRIEENKSKIDKLKNDILKYLKEGKTPIEISKIMNIPESNVLYYKDKFIKQDLIKQEDVADREKNRVKDIEIKKQKVVDLIKRKVFTKEQIIKLLDYFDEYLKLANKEQTDEKEREELLTYVIKETDEKVDKKLVYELTTIEIFKYEEIGNLFGITRKDVGRIKSNLRPKNKEENNSKDDINIHFAIQLQILNLLKQGYNGFYIIKKLEIGRNDLNKFIKTAIKEQKISKEEIDNAIQDKLARDKIEVVQMLKNGYTYRDIIKEKDEYNSTNIVKFIQTLVDEGLITEQEAKSKNNNVEDRLNKIDNLVLQGLKEGLSATQIIDANPEVDILTLGSIRNSRKRLIQSEKIKEEEIQEAKKQIAETDLQQHYIEIENEIYELMKQGYTSKEIQQELQISHTLFYQRKKSLFERENIDSDELEKIQKESKKIRNEEKAQIKMEQEKKEKIISKYEEAKDAVLKSRDLVSAKRKFLKAVNELSENGIVIKNEDLALIDESLLFDEQLLNRESIQLLITQYLKRGNLSAAEKFVNQGASFYKETEYYKIFIEIGNFIKEKRRNNQKITEANMPKIDNIIQNQDDDEHNL